jgi:RNA polymerase sigma factor (sigma-70 family)
MAAVQDLPAAASTAPGAREPLPSEGEPNAHSPLLTVWPALSPVRMEVPGRVVFPGSLARGWLMERPDDDSALLARLAAGEREAIDRLYGRYGRPLYAFVCDVVGDPGLAEEIVQDTFVAAWRGARGFEGRSSVSSWLFAIARRQARDRQRRTGPELAPVEDLAVVPASDPEPEAAAVASATRAELAGALASLPGHHREVLILAFVAELGGSDIASVLGIPEGTVKSRMHAARRALRERLSQESGR